MDPVSKEHLHADHQRLCVHWHDLIEQAGHAAPLLKNYLIDAKPLQVDQDRVVIGFDPEFESGLDNVDVPRNRTVLQKVLGRFLHREVRVTFKIMAPDEALPTDIRLPEGHTRSPTAEAELPPDAVTAEQRWARHPAVRKVLELFNGEIIDIRE